MIDWITEEIYLYILLAEITILLAISFLIFCNKTPKRDNFTKIELSFRIFGVATGIWALYLIPMWITHWGTDTLNPAYFYAARVSGYYLLIRLIGISTICLIYPVSIDRLSGLFWRWAIISLTLAMTVTHDLAWFSWIADLAGILSITDTIYVALSIVKDYNSVIKKSEEILVEDLKESTSWIRNSCIAVCLWFIMGLFIGNYGIPEQALFATIGCILFVSIYILYTRSIADMKIHHTLEVIIEDEHTKLKKMELNTVTIPEEAKKDNTSLQENSHNWLETPVNVWVEKKGFLDPIVSIEELAVIIGTNRAYLSSYINTKYNMNFRTWIASLRLNYAEQLMREDDTLSIAEIAERVNYSQNGFCSIFKKHYGMSISQWKKEQSIIPEPIRKKSHE